MHGTAAQDGGAMIALAEALAWIGDRFAPLGSETVPLGGACGRVLAETLAPLAPARRAGIDGHAVRAAETEGASDYAPLPVASVAVVAGAALLAGTDAVLPPHMVEGATALAAVAPGEGAQPPDGLGLAAGIVLQPAHLAAAALHGRTELAVIRRPSVALRVAGAKAGPDALTPMLQAMIAAEGGTIGLPDLVLLAGRSGPGPDDDGVRAFDSVFAHGIRMRPGESCALGVIGGIPALLLPGDPVACAIAFAVLAAPSLRRLAGRADPAPVTVTLARKIVSGIGQVELVRVRLEGGQATPLPPILCAAEGLVLVPEGSEGYPAGAAIAMYPLP